ncbi:right-handed parallel beta-helix repeat-containing protein [Chloroflexota bacterium]
MKNTNFAVRSLYPRIILILLLSLSLSCNFLSIGETEASPMPAPTKEAMPTLPPDPTTPPPGPEPTRTDAAQPEPTREGPDARQWAVYYVSPSGSDDNPGTEVEPWLTIQKAADTLEAGETVYIRAGTYHESVQPKNTGVEGAYITYTAYPGEQVTIDGSGVSLDEWSGLIEIFGLIFIKVSGLRLVNSADAGILVDECGDIVIEDNYIYNTVSSGIGVWSSHGIIIDGNEVELANNDGEQENITVAVTDNFQVRYNHVHHGGPGSNGGEGIDAKDGSSNGKVYGNYVHHLTRVGIYVDAWDKHTYNIDVYDNLVHDIGDEGFMISSEAGGLLENVRVFNNIAYHNRWNGLAISGCCSDLSGSHPMKNIQVVNNTFYDNGWDEWGGGIYSDNPDVENVLVRNNIVSQNLGFQIMLEGAPASEFTIDHNLIDGYRGEDGEIYGSDYIEGDPLFVNPGEADFHLQESSPAIDQGICTSAPQSDYEGEPRCQAGVECDIGADEVYPTNVYLPIILI